MNFSDHFPRTQSFYNQNPQKVHFAAGVGLVATVTTSFLARVTSAPLPKTAKLAIFGLTSVSNLASLNMKDASLGELAKVMMIGKNIIDNIILDAKNVLSECYKYIGEAQITADINTNLTKTVLPVEQVNSEKDAIVKLPSESLAPDVDIEGVGLIPVNNAITEGQMTVLSVVDDKMNPEKDAIEVTLPSNNLAVENVLGDTVFPSDDNIALPLAHDVVMELPSNPSLLEAAGLPSGVEAETY